MEPVIEPPLLGSVTHDHNALKVGVVIFEDNINLFPAADFLDHRGVAYAGIFNLGVPRNGEGIFPVQIRGRSGGGAFDHHIGSDDRLSL